MKISRHPAAKKQPSLRVSATKKRSPRFQFTAEEETAEILVELARKKRQSLSSIVSQLVEEALEAREHAHWSKVLKERAPFAHERVNYNDVRQQLLQD